MVVVPSAFLQSQPKRSFNQQKRRGAAKLHSHATRWCGPGRNSWWGAASQTGPRFGTSPGTPTRMRRSAFAPACVKGRRTTTKTWTLKLPTPDVFRALKQPGFETPKHLRGCLKGSGLPLKAEARSLWAANKGEFTHRERPKDHLLLGK